MIHKFNWKRWIYILGLILFFLGTLDPLEGAVLILAGSILITLIIAIDRKDMWKSYLMSSIAIGVGVAFLFYFSTLGGWGRSSTLPKAWAIVLLPYPLGWIATIVLLVKSLRKKKINQPPPHPKAPL